MAGGDPKYDLSPNDRAAIGAALDRLASAKSYERCSSVRDGYQCERQGNHVGSHTFNGAGLAMSWTR